MPYFPEAETPQQAKAIMDNCIKVCQFRVKWKDIFDAKQFYTALKEWLEEYGWSSHEKAAPENDDFESLYFEKVGGMGDKELWIRWRTFRIPQDNSYYKYHLDVDFHFLYLLPTEVMHEGKKFKKGIFKGEVEVQVGAYIQFDRDGKWSKHFILRRFNQIFPKRIFKKDLYDNKKKELYREAYILQNYIKHWLKLKRFLPHEEIKPWHPSFSFPTYQRQS